MTSGGVSYGRMVQLEAPSALVKCQIIERAVTRQANTSQDIYYLGGELGYKAHNVCQR